MQRFSSSPPPPNLKLAVCLATRAHVHSDFWPLISELKELAERDGYDAAIVRMSGCSMLEMARSFIASRALDKGADVLLWIDDDMVFCPSDAMKLVRAVSDSLPPTFVGAAAVQRKPRGNPNVVYKNPRPGNTVKFFEKNSGIIEVHSIGMGMVATHADVYRDIRRERLVDTVNGLDQEPMATYFKSIIHEGEWLSEDITFCHLARRAGHPIYLDTSIRLGHRGDYDYYLEDSMGAVPRLNELAITFQEPGHG